MIKNSVAEVGEVGPQSQRTRPAATRWPLPRPSTRAIIALAFAWVAAASLVAISQSLSPDAAWDVDGSERYRAASLAMTRGITM